VASYGTSRAGGKVKHREGAGTMLEAKTIDRGRGTDLEGTRITVYDVLDYHKLGWHRDMIADTLELSSQQVEVAIRYIDEHWDEVMADYSEMLAREARGNPPELQAKLDAGHERFLAMVRELREGRRTLARLSDAH
jgi:Protein of unknown function (DUF433)